MYDDVLHINFAVLRFRLQSSNDGNVCLGQNVHSGLLVCIVFSALPANTVATCHVVYGQIQIASVLG